MGGSHMHEPASREAGDMAEAVTDPAPPSQDTAAQVELLAVRQYRHGLLPEPRSVLGRERQREPVRGVDEALVDRYAAGDLRPEFVEAADDVGGRVVHSVGVRLRCGSAGGEVAV